MDDFYRPDAETSWGERNAVSEPLASALVGSTALNTRRKCAICRTQQRAWSLQPFGPDDGPTFMLPGSHHRGFPAIACCDACKARIQAGEQVVFTYRKQSYVLSAGRVFVSPF